MNKVEDKAKEFLKKLVSHTTLYKDTIDELEVYEPDDVIWAYNEGYNQAKKDLKLTWESIEKIVGLYEDVYTDFSCNGESAKIDTKEHYQKVLKRFKERKENG